MDDFVARTEHLVEDAIVPEPLPNRALIDAKGATDYAHLLRGLQAAARKRFLVFIQQLVMDVTPSGEDIGKADGTHCAAGWGQVTHNEVSELVARQLVVLPYLADSGTNELLQRGIETRSSKRNRGSEEVDMGL